MPRTTLASIQRQIDKLQLQAERLRAKEVPGVIERIRAAIAHYGLKPQDLFGTDGHSAASATGKAQRSQKRPAKVSTSAARTPAAKKKASPIRFRDENGNAWTGNGKRPRWFLQALANGKTREDLAVGP